MPVQYVIEEWDFRDITLKMKPPVFIPRPETEVSKIFLPLFSLLHTKLLGKDRDNPSGIASDESLFIHAATFRNISLLHFFTHALAMLE